MEVQHDTIDVDVQCYHCGQPCEDVSWQDDKPFCCVGCKTVYEILSTNDLCEYYNYQQNPGIQLNKPVDESAYDYLNEPAIRQKLLTFNSDTFSRVNFFVPAIHCVSCIWLLENLKRLDGGIVKSEVNFARKQVVIDFNPEKISLARVASLMATVGYAPVITLDDDTEKAQHGRSFFTADKQLITKLAIAGFCFGNVMLFSFPEYLGLEGEDSLKEVFSWLNVLLSVPVLLYSGIDYLTSAWKSFKQRQINIDVPIAVGLIALFGRSLWEIITGYGPGYFDSFTGLVFFLLIGRWFQSKTYQSLAFDRDFKSYFPLAVQRRQGNEWKPVVIYELRMGDEIKIRNMEIVPADSTLLTGEGFMDYSFVTGESRPVKITPGSYVYAGGRLIGQPVTLRVDKETSQSHLTSLWNNAIFKKPLESRYRKILDKAAQRFTWIVLAIALITAGYWYLADASQVWLIVTAVLMVACPCALALTAPFTYGTMLRQFGRHGLYLKNADVIERMAGIDALVFDKTGTLTHGLKPQVDFVGRLSDNELANIRRLCSFSTHPLSTIISQALTQRGAGEVKDFKEIPAQGIEACINTDHYQVGSARFTGALPLADDSASVVFVSINEQPRGYFQIKTSVRENIEPMLRRWNRPVAMVSGDNDADKDRMKILFGADAQLLFNQNPHDKLNYVKELQQAGNKVLMLGDGLNDSGALKQADVGLAVTDDTGVFTPSCDGILQGDKLPLLDRFLHLAKSATTIVKSAFVLSFLYNAIALSFAVTGHLTPLIAAVLMPLSSISVVVFTTVSVNLVAARKFAL
ncbi:MAG: heavy metal translocating P-type ATPase metal-binding domain-containing protein [Flammeovirgaceae bacterium]|nr:MAG: heavy metal translocating P-type ATPase metal-binding domain-containing protein [Flammeovirgaceae bacterium]